MANNLAYWLFSRKIFSTVEDANTKRGKMIIDWDATWRNRKEVYAIE